MLFQNLYLLGNKLGHLHDRLEAQRLRDGEVSEDLAVQRYLISRKIAHEQVVGNTVHPSSCIDSLNPELAVLSFPDLHSEVWQRKSEEADSVKLELTLPSDPCTHTAWPLLPSELQQ